MELSDIIGKDSLFFFLLFKKILIIYTIKFTLFLYKSMVLNILNAVQPSTHRNFPSSQWKSGLPGGSVVKNPPAKQETQV